MRAIAMARNRPQMVIRPNVRFGQQRTSRL